MNRRKLLLATLAAPLLTAQNQDPDTYARIFQAVWEGARDHFYDPAMRGVDWSLVRQEFSPKARACTSRAELLSLLRQMLRRLHNSHVLLYSRDDWKLRQHILPFWFDSVNGRAFVRYVLRGKDAAPLCPLDFGDEIVAVDDVPATALHPVTLAGLEEIKGNPNFGPPDSAAKVQIRRHGKVATVPIRRVVRPSGFEDVVLEHPRPGVIQLRFFSLGTTEHPATRLRELWESVVQTQCLVLDLRNCVGGYPATSNFIAGSLLGGGKPLFRAVPRPGSQYKEVEDQSAPDAPRFKGRAAVLINSNTESQPEVMAAICKEYGCARLFGTRTAGAFNGFTEAISLPDNAALFAVPYTRSISAKGIEYEQRGVEPDEPVSNSIGDFAAQRDQPLLHALRYLRPSR